MLRSLASASTRPAARSARPAARRTFLRPGRAPDLKALDVEQLARARRDYDRTRMVFLASGAAAGLVAMAYTAWQIKAVLQTPTRMDAGPALPAAGSAGDPHRPVVVHDADGREMVPTGNSTVPLFPRTLGAVAELATEPTEPAEPAEPAEYTLVGLGTRSVSFLGIQVYVVGFYMATADIAALQHRLVKRVNPIATALVPGEKTELRAALLDPAASEALWGDELLAAGVPARSLFRIVPVRDTDFPHLRDGFVRAIQARAPAILAKETSTDPGSSAGSPTAPPDFADSVRQFRQAFHRGKAPKRCELLLVRGADGALAVLFDDGRGAGRQRLGAVADERLSRALWLNYLAGPKVASEPARQSIVDGVLGFVERPVGTVAAQVV